MGIEGRVAAHSMAGSSCAREQAESKVDVCAIRAYESMRAAHLEQLLDSLHLGRAQPPGHLGELVRASGSAERREQRAETMATQKGGALFGVVGLHAGVADKADLPAQAADAGSELWKSTQERVAAERTWTQTTCGRRSLRG